MDPLIAWYGCARQSKIDPRNSVKFLDCRLITSGWERALSHPPVAYHTPIWPLWIIHQKVSGSCLHREPLRRSWVYHSFTRQIGVEKRECWHLSPTVTLCSRELWDYRWVGWTSLWVNTNLYNVSLDDCFPSELQLKSTEKQAENRDFFCFLMAPRDEIFWRSSDYTSFMSWYSSILNYNCFELFIMDGEAEVSQSWINFHETFMIQRDISNSSTSTRRRASLISQSLQFGVTRLCIHVIVVQLQYSFRERQIGAEGKHRSVLSRH